MGFWDRLIGQGRDAIEQAASDRIGRVGGSQSAHIDAQNAAVSEFQSLAIEPLRAGQISAAEAIQRIQSIDTGFAIYAQRLGYARALAGAADVHVLAGRLIASITTSGQPSVLGGLGLGTIAAIAGAAIYFLKGRR